MAENNCDWWRRSNVTPIWWSALSAVSSFPVDSEFFFDILFCWKLLLTFSRLVSTASFATSSRNKTQIRIGPIASSPSAESKSTRQFGALPVIGAARRQYHLLTHNLTGNNNFLLVFCDDIRSGWNRCGVVSRQRQQTVTPNWRSDLANNNNSSNNKAVTDRRFRPRFAIVYIIKLRVFTACCSATTRGLAAWMHHQAGWLTVPVLHRHPCIWPIMYKYDVIHKPGST